MSTLEPPPSRELPSGAAGRALLACFVAAAAAVSAGGCVAPADASPPTMTTDPRDARRHGEPPLLGVPFGEFVTIEAEPFTVEGGKSGLPRAMLRVLRVDGVAAAPGTSIAWTYGGWDAAAEHRAAPDGIVLGATGRYRLRGYETGWWAGMPQSMNARFDDFGPRAGVGFHFHHCFRVVDGERIDAAAGR